MKSPQQLIAEVRNKVYIAAPEDCWGGFIEACDNLGPATKAMLREAPTDLALLTDALEIAIKALGMVDQLEALPLPDAKTLLKKHNVMATFAREAQTKITELIAKRGEA